MLMKAYENLSCFRVIGHGIPSSLHADMKSTMWSLFDLPAQIKRLNSDIIPGSGYVAPSPANPLYEAFGLYNTSSSLDILSFCSNH